MLCTYFDSDWYSAETAFLSKTMRTTPGMSESGTLEFKEASGSCLQVSVQPVIADIGMCRLLRW